MALNLRNPNKAEAKLIAWLNATALDFDITSAPGLATLIGTPVAFTQTYSTAAATVPAATFAAVTLTQSASPAGGTGATAGAFDTAQHRDDAIASINAARTDLIALKAAQDLDAADLLAVKKVVNKIIDLLQTAGVAS